MKPDAKTAKCLATQFLGIMVIMLILQGISLVSAGGPYQDQSQGQSVQVYRQHFPIAISEDSDFLAFGFPGNGTAQNPFRIQDLNISYGGYCISITGTKAHFVINDCIFRVGMNSVYCINLESVENGLIENCLIEGGSEAISMFYCTNMQILNNTCVKAQSDGIVTSGSSNNYLANNIIAANQYGMRMYSERNSTIAHNRIYANFGYGIELYTCSNNTVESNLIGWNALVQSPITRNADDDSNTDLWVGNYYSDYSGVGAYQIDGKGNETDTEPFQLTDTTAPQMKSPDSVVIPADAEELRCNFTDDYPLTYKVLIGNEVAAKGYWFDGSVSVPVSLFQGEDTNVTFQLLDGAQNSASFTVHVHIQQALDITPIVYTTVAVVGVLAIVVAAEFRRRRKS